MDDGDRLRTAQDHQAALQRYQAAHEIMNVPTTGIEVARTYDTLGKLVEARRMALEVANLPVVPGEAAVMAEARQAASALAASLAPRIPALVIQVSPPEVQSRIVVDGVELPTSVRGLPYRTNPGQHLVQVSAPGYQTSEQRVSLEEGTESSVVVNLVAAAPPPPQPAPAPAPATASQALAPGQAPPAATDSTSPTPDTSADQDGGDSNVYVAFGLAGVGAVVGTIGGLVSLNKTASAKEHCEGDICTPEAEEDIDSARTWAGVSNVGFALAIGTGIWGLVELLSQPNSPSPPPAAGRSPEWSIAIGPKDASAVLKGSF